MNILLFSQIGFWYELCIDKIPNPHFLLQNDFEAFGTLIQASNLPVFTSSYFMEHDSMPDFYPENTRVILPILDEEAYVHYFLACKLSDKKRFRPLFKRISE